jgi:hypothetical protein
MASTGTFLARRIPVLGSPLVRALFEHGIQKAESHLKVGRIFVSVPIDKTNNGAYYTAEES